MVQHTAVAVAVGEPQAAVPHKYNTTMQEHLQELQSTLTANGLRPVGEPVYSRYNAPFTPWFMRRNEIWLHLSGAP
jgi:hypothetical protein